MFMPKIAVPLPLGGEQPNYMNALSAAGAAPFYIIRPENLPEDTDGILLPGGQDLDPALYGQKNTDCGPVDRQLDSLQYAVLKKALTAGIPVLGICRGEQLINTYFGGTLVQDLPTSDAHKKNAAGIDNRNISIAREGSWIASLYGNTFAHNSSHHQGVDRLGNGLIVDARCKEDQVVEALHHESLPVFAVQFHPERMCLSFADERFADGLKLFTYFLEICKGMRR